MISFEDLPPEVRRRIEAESAAIGKQRQKVTAWRDVPPSWGVCKEHGWVWWPKDAGCVLCEGEADGCGNSSGGSSSR